MKKLILLLTLSLLGLSAQAQDCSLTLSGVVFDNSPAYPLSYANIYIEELGEGTATDDNGRFELGGLCAGEYHLSVSHLGCHPERIFLDLRGDTTLQIALAHQAALLESVEVRGQQERNAGQSQETLTRQELEEGAGKNLANLLENIAGLSVIRNGSGIAKPVIHGLTGNRIAILNNGIIQAGQQWGVDHAPEIDPFTADRIKVIKGVESLAYGGNTLGGAVLVEPGNIPQDPHLHGATQYVLETNGRQHTVSTRLEKKGSWVDWRVIGTFKQGGDHRTPDYFLRNTGVRERNAALQLQKTINDHWFHTLYYSYFHTEVGILRGAHIANTTDLETAIGREEPFYTRPNFSYELEEPRQRVQHHLLKYNTKYYLAPNRSLQLTYAGQLNRREEFDVRRGDRSERAALDLALQSHFVDVFWQDEAGHATKKIGLQYRYNENDNQPGTGVFPLIPDYNSHLPAAYFIWQLQHDRQSYQLGARYDFVALDVATITQDLPRRVERFSHRFHNYSAAAGWQYRVSKAWSSKLNLGVVRRSPEVNELYSQGLHQGVASIEEGNASLQPELSVKGVWTNSLQLSESFWLEATAYYQLVSDFIYLEPQEEARLTIRGAFPVFGYQQTNARLAGLDVNARYEWNPHWQWQAQYAMVRGYDRSQEKPLVYIPSDRIQSEISWLGTSVGKLTEPKLTVGGRYVFEQTRLLASQDFLAPPPAYLLLDASVGGAISWSGNTLHLGVQFNNLLNERYRDYLNRLRYYADEEGRNIRVNVRLEF
ncbi:TonB-dependent receptor [Lewinella sp. LCG006]|uniref:TonB-dependent receptor n=1 Tax=Lewinella sp. LCG006 TaxID=3231911 RepID=UPI00345FA550